MGSLRRATLEELSDRRKLNAVYRFYDSVYGFNKHTDLTSVLSIDNSKQMQNYRANGVAEVSISFPNTIEYFNRHENILLWTGSLEPQIRAAELKKTLVDNLDLNLYSGEQIPASAQTFDPKEELKALHFSFKYLHHIGNEEIPIEVEIDPLYAKK